MHRNPQPQVAEGIWLGSRPEVRAMMDLSDGLASDLKHILDRSGVGAEVAVEQIPAAPGADVRMAACSGEDYKLLLTAAPEAAERLAADFRIPLRHAAPSHRPHHRRTGPRVAPQRKTRPAGLARLRALLMQTRDGHPRLPAVTEYVPFALHEKAAQKGPSQESPIL